MENIQQSIELFKKVDEILEAEKYLSELRGESFNIFRLLGLEGNEAGFHTKFLFELLNPQGSHGKGAIFFDEFVRTLNQLLPREKNIPKVYSHFNEVKKEIYVGRINHQDIEGGIIDLYFETDRFALAIENKVYSGLGYLQLERYHQFLSNKTNKSKFLILLSPFEYKYSGELIEGKHFYHLKYEQMIPWLEFCMEKSADFPILRETIKQYIISVKGVLGMLNSKEMNDKLIKLISDNYEVAKQIAETYHQAKDLRIRKMYEQLIPKLKEVYPIEIWNSDFSMSHIDWPWAGFYFGRKIWDARIQICFEGNPKMIDGIVPLIMLQNEGGLKKEELKNIFKGRFRPIDKPEKNFKVTSTTKFKKFNFVDFGDKNHEQIAQEIFEYVVETVNILENDILKIEEILKH